jgi:hypothetical protein
LQTTFGADGITELESQLAHFRVLLEKKWGHDHDNSFTYFPPDASYSLPLTPYMLKEWARALVSSHLYSPNISPDVSQYDGADLVSVSVPPNSPLFDPANRVAVLNPVGRAHVTSIVPQTPAAAAPQPNNIESLASLIKDINGIVNHTPSTPIRGALSHNCVITSPNVLLHHNSPDSFPTLIPISVFVMPHFTSRLSVINVMVPTFYIEFQMRLSKNLAFIPAMSFISKTGQLHGGKVPMLRGRGVHLNQMAGLRVNHLQSILWLMRGGMLMGADAISLAHRW